MTRRRGSHRAFRDILGATIAKNRLGVGMRRARAVLLWPEVVGPDLSRLTRARSQYGTTLHVEAQDSVLANFLTMQRQVFLQRLQAKLGDESITELRFSVGTFMAEAARRPDEPLPPPDCERAAQIAEGVPENVRDSARKAAEAITRARLWRERQGFPLCPVCGVPAREAPCAPCRNLLTTPSVRRAARQLVRSPEGIVDLPASLGDTGAAAARHIALKAVQDQLEPLAVECARAGGAAELRDFLRAQAEVWLALHHRKRRADLTRTDWSELPQKVMQVLSAGR